MTELSVLFVGDLCRKEFQDAVQPFQRLARIEFAVDLDGAAARLASVAADLVVLAQAWPGQYSGEAIDRLRGLAPLARIVGLLGSWCEGEMRSGRPWPGVVRVYWHQWPARCARELADLAEGHCSAWSLPATASEEERLLAEGDACPPGGGLIVIHTPSFESYDWLAAACRRFGSAVLWIPPHRPVRMNGATAALFDATDARGAEQDALERLCRQVHPAPVIALVDFPRPEDRQRIIAAGAKAVLSKPLAIEDLRWHLDVA